MLTSTTRDHSLSLRQWWDTNYEALQQQSEFVYTTETTTPEGATYLSYHSFVDNVGVRSIMSYINDNYDADMKLKRNDKIRIVAIR